jgi:hypothetical protein
MAQPICGAVVVIGGVRYPCEIVARHLLPVRDGVRWQQPHLARCFSDDGEMVELNWGVPVA